VSSVPNLACNGGRFEGGRVSVSTAQETGKEGERERKKTHPKLPPVRQPILANNLLISLAQHLNLPPVKVVFRVDLVGCGSAESKLTSSFELHLADDVAEDSFGGTARGGGL
jgi:hypothetical protein